MLQRGGLRWVLHPSCKQLLNARTPERISCSKNYDHYYYQEFLEKNSSYKKTHISPRFKRFKNSLKKILPTKTTYFSTIFFNVCCRKFWRDCFSEIPWSMFEKFLQRYLKVSTYYFQYMAILLLFIPSNIFWKFVGELNVKCAVEYNAPLPFAR